MDRPETMQAIYLDMDSTTTVTTIFTLDEWLTRSNSSIVYIGSGRNVSNGFSSISICVLTLGGIYNERV